MTHIDILPDDLAAYLLGSASSEHLCLLDSCGVGHFGSHLMIAGVEPIETIELTSHDPETTLQTFEQKLSRPGTAAIFTISYDFGLKLQNIERRKKEISTFDEPDISLMLFDCLIVHDYAAGKTFLTGNPERFAAFSRKLESRNPEHKFDLASGSPVAVNSNFSKDAYLEAVETIKEHIRRGDTYQTNLTQQLTAELPKDLTPETIFWRLRKNHPAPFSAFIRRSDSTVISASPERFIKIENGTIKASPIKGTRPRGETSAQDDGLRKALLSSKKDLAENTMIVDLLRNDLGRVCEFGSVRVEKLCELVEHPTLFHLVSTISGKLGDKISYSEIIRAVFPCGSITGTPKIRTMQIIDEIETANRGLSMGAIGYCIPDAKFGLPASFDMSVAIRTMVIRKQQAVFNVGGGVVIDSDPADEYEESMLKAKGLLAALGSEFRL